MSEGTGVDQHLFDDVETVAYTETDDCYQGTEAVHRKPLQRKPKKKKKHGKKKSNKLQLVPEETQEQVVIQQNNELKEEKEIKTDENLIKDDEFNHAHGNELLEDEYKKEEPVKRKPLGGRKPLKRKTEEIKEDSSKVIKEVNEQQIGQKPIQKINSNEQTKVKNETENVIRVERGNTVENQPTSKHSKNETKPFLVKKPDLNIEVKQNEIPKINMNEVQTKSNSKSWLSPRKIIGSPKSSSPRKIIGSKEEKPILSPKSKDNEIKQPKDVKGVKKTEKKTKKTQKIEDDSPDPMTTKQLIVKTDNEQSVFSIANSIGRGAYGEVFQGMNADSGEFVAIKQMKVNKKSVMNEVMEEIRLLKKLKHNHVVRYIASYQSHGFLYIIMEYMESGSLLNIVKKFNHLNESLSAKYMHQVLDGLSFIHDQGIVHRDIKAANILVAKDGSVKIADFGVSVQTNGTEKKEGGNNEDPIGTPNWMAPEVIQMQGTTVKADIWALGCTIIELITGNPPYFDINPTAALYKIVSDDHPPFPSTVSTQLRDFMFSCFKRDPNQRASSRDLLKHKWFVTNGIKVEEENHQTKVNAANNTMFDIKVKASIAKGEAEDWTDGFIIGTPRMREVRTVKYRKNTEDEWGEFFDIPSEGLDINESSVESKDGKEQKSICLEDIGVLENEEDKRKEIFMEKMKEVGELVEIGNKENISKLFQMFISIHEISLDVTFTQLPESIHTIGLFPLFAVLEKEEYNGCLPLRLTSLQIINTILSKGPSCKMNVVMSGCSTVIEFGLNHSKSNDAYLNEIVKFIKHVMTDETNKYELAQMFVTSGGLALIYNILTMRYDDKHKGNMNVILEVVNRFVQSQRDVKTRMDFCSRNITTLLFIKYKLVDGLLEFVCQTFSLKQYTPALKAITILIQIIDYVMRNDTQIKFVVCQRIISTDILGILSRQMDTSINSKMNDFTQEDVLFNVCKLCKLLMYESEKDTINTLFNGKIIFFIVKVLLRCESLDKELKNDYLIKMMKIGLINNVIQCLNILCTSSRVGSKVCLELSSIPNIFLLLKTYCDKSKLNFIIMEGDCLNIILTIATSITKQQSSSDFIVNNSLEFLLEYCSKKGIVGRLFYAFRALYEANKKKGKKILGDLKCIVYLCNIFNLSNYNDGMCSSELKEFSAIINEHEELIQLYSQSTFVYGIASLLRQVSNIEAKKYFATLMKSLLLHNDNVFNLIMKDRIVIYLNETFTECMEMKKEVVSKIVEECLGMVMNAKPKYVSKKEEQKIIERLKKEEELKLKLKKESEKELKLSGRQSKSEQKDHRKGVFFGKGGTNELLNKALEGEFDENGELKPQITSSMPIQLNQIDHSRQARSTIFSTTNPQEQTTSPKTPRRFFSFGKKEEKK